jgi:hypothetical protein
MFVGDTLLANETIVRCCKIVVVVVNRTEQNLHPKPARIEASMRGVKTSE